MLRVVSYLISKLTPQSCLHQHPAEEPDEYFDTESSRWQASQLVVSNITGYNLQVALERAMKAEKEKKKLLVIAAALA